MGYVAVQGGIKAIENAEELAKYLRLKGKSVPVEVQQIIDQMSFLVDRVMGEGGLYSPFHAALAIKQAEGDPLEAAFYVRAYRSTLRRVVDSIPIDTKYMRLSRRISSAFKNIPGGQVLGATPDYRQRILDFSLTEETSESTDTFVYEYEARQEAEQKELNSESFCKVVDMLRDQGLVSRAEQTEETPRKDITKDSIDYPLHRSGRLQMLSRGETGGLLALAYSSMRGFGSIHPTIAELRIGWVKVKIPHPYRKNESITIGSIQISEVEILASAHKKKDEDKPTFSLGYGSCFGHNEVKAISIATLDRTMKVEGGAAPSENQEFVLYHTDGIESSGFCSHFKLPHYITFQSTLDRLRAKQKTMEKPGMAAVGEVLHA